MRIRELGAGEAALLKDLRLRALQDAPGEFADSYESVVEHPQQYWDQTAISLTGESRQRMFIAEVEDSPVGFVYALVAADSDSGSAGGLWVHSRQRRRGIGSALLEAVIDWGQRNHLYRLRVWVARDETPSHRLVLRAGFTPTKEIDASRTKVDKDLVRMVLEFPKESTTWPAMRQ